MRKSKWVMTFIVSLLLYVHSSYSQKGVVQGKDKIINELEQDFLHPPIIYRPYVWWHWLGSNFSKEGITKDLEAMKASGIGGATIFNITSSVVESHQPTLNNPWPNQTYRSPKYWEAIKHAASEAKRLGLDLGLHNTVGYSTTGGPWIDEPKSMQHLVWSEVLVEGNTSIFIQLPKPVLVADEGWGKTGRTVSWFKDIAVLAVPANQKVLRLSDVHDLSAMMDTSGKLSWQVPSGKWYVYRLAHASTGRAPHPIPDDLLGKVLEADKMNLEQTKYHWSNVLEPLKAHLGPLMGTGLKHLLIDSYEAGYQNWSENFRADFIKLKGYDPLPWLMTFNATVQNGKKAVKGKDAIIPIERTIENPELSARFEWDYKDVISHLFYHNGWKPAASFIHSAGLQVQHEAYGGPFSTVEGTALADIPMLEFWSGRKTIASPVVTGSARAAGRKIIGAEALTGSPINSKWSEVPSFLKPTLDGGYATGVNRMILHHWVHQPFADQFKPGLGMGWWGTHFSRHQTWFEPGKDFFLYMGRVQSMLQKGETTVNVLSLGGDSPLADLISNDVFLHDLKLENGKLALPSGRKYHLLLVPHNGKLLPEIVAKMEALLKAGANIVSAKPMASPSLANYPHCDEQLNELAKKIWGTKGDSVVSIGKGKLYIDSSGKGLVKIISALGIIPTVQLTNPDRDIQIQQRTKGEASWFFIANTGQQEKKIKAIFAISNLIPELWDAEAGSIVEAPIWRTQNKSTEIELELSKQKSLFVVFRKKIPSCYDHLTSIQANADFQLRPLRDRLPLIESANKVEGYVNYASGKSKAFKLTPADTIALKLQPQVSFLPAIGNSFIVKNLPLASFTNSLEHNIKYFSGTATYTIHFQLNANSLVKDRQYQLDLGQVFDMATVKVNGKIFRVFWNPPFTGNVSDYLKLGDNVIEIAVTNTWHNLMVGDEQYPADFEWGVDRGESGRMMKAYPDWFLKNQPRTEKNRKAFTVWYYHRKDTPLLPAGLLGPVYLIVKNSINLNLQ